MCKQSRDGQVTVRTVAGLEQMVLLKGRIVCFILHQKPKIHLMSIRDALRKNLHAKKRGKAGTTFTRRNLPSYLCVCLPLTFSLEFTLKAWQTYVDLALQLLPRGCVHLHHCTTAPRFLVHTAQGAMSLPHLSSSLARSQKFGEQCVPSPA